ncbi:cupin domain-containing protein [Marinomonas mediterranea]|uniref:Cupin type-2 domain-containing protein n=1 Tax=Marinomonas mediterranea (strain ATCC 700492 / JCM 21426 / NBRC 103028 / MMB-1) TaxID=717774 RepID=F2K424_MARM1|nr:cupin domain-containing protein [Marinomonas mediterranea]ADZ91366.1 hypothetical protein Marme_2122 [Marinomonas mediterranea MMB-1]WCN09339.1 cupin domain-containing protein [Marinomonas mediterranea]WCN13416.1 cupin domain-containing protein [Marinomonas mediterranea]WCN17484.1 cupin domain-containing protein [Marinomonas mediterranea MMB-1]
MSNSMIEEIQDRWKRAGYSFFLWHDPPKKNWPVIIHPMDEVVVLLKGKLVFIVNGEKVNFDINQEVFVPSDSPHSVHNIGNSTNCWCYGYRIKGGNEI